MNLSDTLKYLRAEKGLTQTQLAKMLEITQDSISLWEKGKRTPDTQYIVKLADVFEVSTDYLLGRSDDFGNVTVQSSVPALPAKERELLTTFRRLSNDYQTLALSTLKNWADMPAQNSTTKRA